MRKDRGRGGERRVSRGRRGAGRDGGAGEEAPLLCWAVRSGLQGRAHTWGPRPWAEALHRAEGGATAEAPCPLCPRSPVGAGSRGTCAVPAPARPRAVGPPHPCSGEALRAAPQGQGCVPGGGGLASAEPQEGSAGLTAAEAPRKPGAQGWRSQDLVALRAVWGSAVSVPRAREGWPGLLGWPE